MGLQSNKAWPILRQLLVLTKRIKTHTGRAYLFLAIAKSLVQMGQQDRAVSVLRQVYTDAKKIKKGDDRSEALGFINKYVVEAGLQDKVAISKI